MTAVQKLVALVMMHVRGILHRTELLVFSVAVLIQHVAEHRIGNARLHVNDLVLIVDIGRHAVLAERRDFDVGRRLSARQ